MTYFRGFSHIGIQVSSLDRSIDFYVGCLGFALYLRGQAPEHVPGLTGYPGAIIDRALLTFPGDTTEPGSSPFFEVIEFQKVEKESVDASLANPGTAHIALWVRDLETLHESLLEQGVSFVSEIKVSASGPNKGGKAVFALDPDGIAIELIQPSVWPVKF